MYECLPTSVLLAQAVSLLERGVADKQTDRQTNKQTDATQRHTHACSCTAGVCDNDV